ncbi:PD-(D/E)XK nuclease superfamily protein [Gimesia chilikensis]|uniref:PD-(D/E)XK nuclease superfamily protein n=1 Tax=Gimesia chilikensis TaxID=2605989 RepID=A0A517WKE6_9PLAN|nr:PD-(D/E)XK nuclease family protein [Gimesia chilikensis]QDU05720.1 PD-(D/E)XK nuclease superfamily protein [Gimesia chilikensis]
MSDTIKWSFSSDRCFRRCQRQYFLTQIAAYHSAKDPVRREAFLCKQLKTLELWRGSLIHTGIEKYVVPAWQQRCTVNWDSAIKQTQELAQQQLAFSVARRYREEGMTKTKAGDRYCALVGHESEVGVSDEEFGTVLTTIETCLRNLSAMSELLGEIQRAEQIWCELPLYIQYDTGRLEVHLDLMFFRSFGQPTIIDWKVSESMGGSDADLQTGLYAWAMCQHPKWRVKEASDCELVEVQLLSNDVIRHRTDDKTFDCIENRIYRSLDSIQSLRQRRKFSIADIEEYEFATNANSCAICSQQMLCRQIAQQQREGELPTAPVKERKKKTKEKSHVSCLELF